MWCTGVYAGSSQCMRASKHANFGWYFQLEIGCIWARFVIIWHDVSKNWKFGNTCITFIVQSEQPTGTCEPAGKLRIFLLLTLSITMNLKSSQQVFAIDTYCTLRCSTLSLAYATCKDIVSCIILPPLLYKNFVSSVVTLKNEMQTVRPGCWLQLHFRNSVLKGDPSNTKQDHYRI